MKQIMLKRLSEIKEQNNGFSKGLQKWQKFVIDEIHISEFDFNNINDEKFLDIFERVLRTHYKQY